MMAWLRHRPALSAVLGVMALAALMLGAMLLLSRRPPPDTPPVPQVDAKAPAGADTIAVPTMPTPAPEVTGVPERPQTGGRWQSASTQLEAAAETLSEAVRAARAGDAAAQYHVARTVRFCRSLGDSADGVPEVARGPCREILAHPGLPGLGAGQPGDAWVTMLGEAVRAGEPRALGYAALHCVDGSACDPMGGTDRNMSLAAAQSRAGRAIASGDPEAIFNAGLAIASATVGRNPLRGTAWLLVACRKGYDCSASNELNEALRCPSGETRCATGGNLEDRLQAELGPGGFAEAYALSQEFSQLLEAGDPPVRSWAFGR